MWLDRIINELEYGRIFTYSLLCPEAQIIDIIKTIALKVPSRASDGTMITKVFVVDSSIAEELKQDPKIIRSMYRMFSFEDIINEAKMRNEPLDTYVHQLVDELYEFVAKGRIRVFVFASREPNEEIRFVVRTMLEDLADRASAIIVAPEEDPLHEIAKNIAEKYKVKYEGFAASSVS